MTNPTAPADVYLAEDATASDVPIWLVQEGAPLAAMTLEPAQQAWLEGMGFEGKAKQRDASGNIRLHDIGLFLKAAITDFFRKEKMEINLKYIDPSYMIRSVSANTNDDLLCSLLARTAVHAGMAGKTKMLVGLCNNQFVHIPMEASAGKPKRVDCAGDMWMSVLETTGQPSMKN